MNSPATDIAPDKNDAVRLMRVVPDEDAPLSKTIGDESPAIKPISVRLALQKADSDTRGRA